nr:Hypothetical protein CBG16872 [Haemonchus contortus]
MTSGESKSTAGEKTHHLHYLNEFRVEACPLFKQHQCQQHRPYTCFNWHFANQRRRRATVEADSIPHSALADCSIAEKFGEITL